MKTCDCPSCRARLTREVDARFQEITRPLTLWARQLEEDVRSADVVERVRAYTEARR